MDTLNIKINGRDYTVPTGLSVLEACRYAGVEIPTLCYLKDINEIGACRLCLTEVKGARGMVAACVYPVDRDGMEIVTNSAKIQEARKTNLKLLLSNHDKKCLSCVRSGKCELQKLCNDYGVDDVDAYKGVMNHYEIDDSAPHMIRDNNKCILCRRCVAVCEKNQSVAVLGANEGGFKTHIGCAFDQDLWATLGECFGMPIGSNVKGKLVAALHRLGFDGVYDTDVGADLTILEEANEFIERVQNGGKLPIITSCSPGWIKFCEHNFPDFLDNLSTCKSPQQMFGAVVKTWYAEKNGLDPKDIVVVSIMPCTAKKFERSRDGQSAAGVPDVDIALTTRELGRMIERAGIDFVNLPDEEFDAPLGITTGAAAIFGATGGVMEAALRTAVETLTGEKLEKLDFTEVRGTQGIKEATYNVAGLEVKAAVASGLANARELLNRIRRGEANYHIVEIMACPGGCVNGGGQPIQPASVRNFTDLKGIRAKALYEEDANLPLRKSHDSPVIKMLYDEYFGKPGSHKAHEVLHTHYVARDTYGKER